MPKERPLNLATGEYGAIEGAEQVIHGDLLGDVSEEIRASYFAAGDDHLDAGLQPGADLKPTYLIAADLRDRDLSGADLLGADLRDARLDGADLSKALYLTQPQLNAARGSRATLLPSGLAMPPYWN